MAWSLAKLIKQRQRQEPLPPLVKEQDATYLDLKNLAAWILILTYVALQGSSSGKIVLVLGAITLLLNLVLKNKFFPQARVRLPKTLASALFWKVDGFVLILGIAILVGWIAVILINR